MYYNTFRPTQGSLAQLVEQLTLNQRVTGSSPVRPIRCGDSSVVERDLAKVDVASSNLVLRSIFFAFFARVAELADALDLGSSGFTTLRVQVPPLAYRCYRNTQ